MFDMNQVKQNVGKWTKQGEESATSPAPETAKVRPPPSQSHSAPREAAMIGSSIRINGDLTGEEDLIIDGQVEGTIHLEKNNLTIGANGRIKANIQAKAVIVEGELRGDIVGKEKVVIRRTGNMRGNIVAPRVTLEDGAMFKGSIEMEPEAVRGRETEPAVAALNKDSSASTAAASNAKVGGKTS